MLFAVEAPSIKELKTEVLSLTKTHVVSESLAKQKLYKSQRLHVDGKFVMNAPIVII